MTINVQVDAKTGEVKRAIDIKRDSAGNIIGAEVREQDPKQTPEA